MKNRGLIILAITAFACLCMGVVDAVLQPGYAVKSVIKIMLFLLLPVLYSVFDKKCNLRKLFVLNKSGLLVALLLGIGVYCVILAAYFLFRNVFDFSKLTSSLTATTGVNKSNFIFTALYISFVNSLLEEFFFRGFSFLSMKEALGRKLAYTASSLLFASYHIAMMIGWFAWPVVLLALVGLYIGGVLFDFFNEKYNTIYSSWMIHMFANFATNTIGMILFNT